MLRAAIRIESTGELLSCLLNPNQLVFRRTTGVKLRRSLGGAVRVASSPHHPLEYTGAGTTEFDLDLLFDVSVQSARRPPASNVLVLTRPLFRLAQEGTEVSGVVGPKVVRFVWGKTWNIPAVVVAAAERLECFSATGVPRRSWLRLRLVQVDEPPPNPLALASDALEQGSDDGEVEGQGFDEPSGSPDENAEQRQAPSPRSSATLRFDLRSYRSTGDATNWRETPEAQRFGDPLPPELAASAGQGAP